MITAADFANLEAAWEAHRLNAHLSGEFDLEEDDEMDTYWEWAFAQADAQ